MTCSNGPWETWRNVVQIQETLVDSSSVACKRINSSSTVPWLRKNLRSSSWIQVSTISHSFLLALPFPSNLTSVILWLPEEILLFCAPTTIIFKSKRTVSSKIEQMCQESIEPSELQNRSCATKVPTLPQRSCPNTSGISPKEMDLDPPESSNTTSYKWHYWQL